MGEHLNAETEQLAGSGPPRRLQLLVVTAAGSRVVPLPPVGTLVLGRSEEADVQIDDSSISRRHAALHIGRTMQLEDLGSSNGTRVGEAEVQPGHRVDVHPGDSIELGKTLCLIQGRPRAGERPRRLYTHDYFEARVDDECGRAEAGGTPFGVLRLHVQGPPAVIEPDLLAALRPGDLVALYGPGEYELLLFGDADAVDARTEQMASAASRGGEEVRTGLACFPRDGRSSEALLARACDEVLDAPDLDVPEEIVIEDATMKRLHHLVEKVARGAINILLLGETGAGKEIFAERIHDLSPRQRGAFLRLNCAAFSETLLESELFGHEKGAFTGAASAKPGLLESADGGTVFLDEMGEMPMTLQAKLLRVLEERAVRRVGGLRTVPIDVRFVAATNRDLEAEVAEGRFRADLYFRLNGVTLVIPPLRERPDEIEPLARRFLTGAALRSGLRTVPALSAEARDLLRAYSWPGNIRELKNAMERAVLLASGPVIGLETLPLEKMRAVRARPSALPAVTLPPTVLPMTPPPPRAPVDGSLRSAVEQAERDRIVEALALCNGNQTYAARHLGISRRALITKIEQYGLPRPRKGP